MRMHALTYKVMNVLEGDETSSIHFASLPLWYSELQASEEGIYRTVIPPAAGSTWLSVTSRVKFMKSLECMSQCLQLFV